MWNLTKMIALAKATGIVMLATAAGGLIEAHSLDWPTVMAVGTLVFVGGRRFQKMEDRIVEIERRVRDLPCHGQHVEIRHKCDE